MKIEIDKIIEEEEEVDNKITLIPIKENLLIIYNKGKKDNTFKIILIRISIIEEEGDKIIMRKDKIINKEVIIMKKEKTTIKRDTTIKKEKSLINIQAKFHKSNKV